MDGCRTGNNQVKNDEKQLIGVMKLEDLDQYISKLLMLDVRALGDLAKDDVDHVGPVLVCSLWVGQVWANLLFVCW
jgi:hypothetical protein